jgi:mannitol/fructose-specific phosphotransferase system IIA component (Ntr-type)
MVMFALACLAVIVMRESRIASYDPGYRSPLYPGLHIAGILGPFWLIVNMGILPTLFTGGLITFGAMWYTYYARERVDREGAIFHIFERLGRQRDEGLDRELREIMKDRGPQEADSIDALLTGACVLDVSGAIEFEDLATQAGQQLARDLPVSASVLTEGFMQGTCIGATPVSHGAALPHVRLDELERAHLALARVPDGVHFHGGPDAVSRTPPEPIRAVFFLVGPKSNPGQHLRILAQIARRVDQASFMPEWLGAENEDNLKEAVFREERVCVITLERGGEANDLIGLMLRELSIPDGTLIAMIRRGDEQIIPKGSTVLHDGDRVTVIGRPEGVRALREQYGSV